MLLTHYKLDTPEQLAIAERLMAVYAPWVLPVWVTEATVRWSADHDLNAQIVDEYEYRRIQIDLGATFFVQEEKCRDRDFVHELCHAVQSPLTTFIETLGAFGKGKQGDALKSLYVKAMESANEDMTNIVWRLLTEKRSS